VGTEGGGTSSTEETTSGETATATSRGTKEEGGWVSGGEER